jgi:protocatechuate 3,4-dioxygenase beta subunit
MRISRRAAIAQIATGSGLVASVAYAQSSALTPTPFQVVGPFYPVRRPDDHDADLTLIDGHNARAAGMVIELTGRVLSARGAPVAGAVIEIWQANAAGRYAHASDSSGLPLDSDFQGFGHIRADAEGRYRLLTVKPGAYPIGGGQVRTPHIHFEIAGREDRLTTQMYFPGEALNETDLLLRQEADPAALIARAASAAADGTARFNWDIVLISG